MLYTFIINSQETKKHVNWIKNEVELKLINNKEKITYVIFQKLFLIIYLIF